MHIVPQEFLTWSSWTSFIGLANHCIGPGGLEGLINASHHAAGILDVVLDFIGLAIGNWIGGDVEV